MGCGSSSGMGSSGGGGGGGSVSSETGGGVVGPGGVMGSGIESGTASELNENSSNEDDMWSSSGGPEMNRTKRSTQLGNAQTTSIYPNGYASTTCELTTLQSRKRKKSIQD